MIHPYHGWLVTCALVQCAFASAQLPSESMTWAYDDLVTMLLEHHPDRQRADLEQRLSMLQQDADVAYSPTPNLTTFRLPGWQGQPSTYYEAQLDFALPAWGQMRTERALLAESERASLALMKEQSMALQLEVEQLILEWIELDERLEVWGRHRDFSMQLASWYEARWQQGEASLSEAQIARWKWQHADHAYHEDWMRKEDIGSLLRWACGNPDLALDSIVPPPYDLTGISALQLQTARMATDAELQRLASDSARAEAERAWTQKSMAPHFSLGYNGQGVQGDIFQGPLVGLIWAPGQASKQRRVADVECERTAWELEAHRRLLQQELAQLWRRHASRMEHLASWYASQNSMPLVTLKSFELLENNVLDLPSFFATWEAELARQLDQIACESELRWLRAQLLLGTSFSSIEQP